MIIHYDYQNMKPFDKACWIWANNSLDFDDYAEFFGEFSSSTKEIEITIAADSVYAFYINDELVKFMQTSDYHDVKYFDTFKYKNAQKENHYKIQVWHYGVDSSVYMYDVHGVIFEIKNKDGVLAYSNENTKSRVMNEFKNGYKKIITGQLGLSFYYDNRIKEEKYYPSILIDKSENFVLRNIHDIELLERRDFRVFKNDNALLVDIYRETAGFIDIEVESECNQLLTISYGEHIEDGCVRRIIGTRDFSIEIYLKKGINKFFNPLRRIAGRYLQLDSPKEVKIIYAGIRPVNYVHKIINKDFHDPLINQIYKTAIDTLELCMHEHYEDCPWREQALYCLDSRNQMLCGYYVFEGYEYQRHNLLLMAKGYDKKTGLLPLTFPCGSNNFAIPFFSLAYIKQVYEYIKYTKDETILEETKDVIDGIMNTFLSRLDGNGLIKYFEKPFWNFYEWTPYSDNDVDLNPNIPTKDEYELTINAMLVHVIDIYNDLFKTNIDSSRIKEGIRKTFYNPDKGIYFLRTGHKDIYSQLSNALLCLGGISDEKMLDALINDKELIEASLSTRGFVYDALLMNGEKYNSYIIEDIKKRYKKMLDNGATSFYETEQGADAFDKAGSLCHGWSSIPIYYFNKLLK